MKLLFLLILGFVLDGNARSIYDGTDNRIDPNHAPNNQKNQIASVAVAMLATELESYPKIFPQSIQSKLNICTDEKFSNEPALGKCTGTLVASNKILTARHCVKNARDCKKFHWVFDYTQTTFAEDKSITLKEKVQCKQVLFEDSLLDISLIEIDTHLSNRKIQKLTKRPSNKIPSYLIGTSLGIPLKIHQDIRLIKNLSYRWKISSDTFDKNSGSPLFNDKNEVLGILVDGSTDLYMDRSENCKRYFKCDIDGPCQGEYIVPVSEFPKEMMDLLK